VGSVKLFAGYDAAEGDMTIRGLHPGRTSAQGLSASLQGRHDADVDTVMSAYLDPNDVPAGGNGFLLREVLRHDLGFKGFVFSGATAVRRTPLFAPCPPA
jgi:beta-glucosidase